MKLFRLENIVLILMLILFVATSLLSVQMDEQRSERMDQCFTEAKENTEAMNICSQIYSAAADAVSSSRRSIYPTLVMIVGALGILTVSNRRLAERIKELENK